MTRAFPPVREITAILVSWSDAAELEPAVASLAASRRRVAGGGVRTSLVVVENGGPVRPEAILALWPSAALLVNDTNRGFGPAANQAARIAKGDVLLFLNPDVRAEGDVFSEIARGLDSDPGAAGLAPRLLDFEPRDGEGAGQGELAPPDREDQATFQLRHLPDLLSDARDLLLLDHLFPNNRWRRRFRYADRGRETAHEVEQPAAAALAIRTAVFWSAGGFDEAFVPAWFEDVDLCARLLPEGPILYWPEARFRHRGGVSAERLGYARFLPIYYGNALRYRRKHYGRPSRLAYRVLLSVGMLLRLAALPFRRRMPRPRGEAARGYLSTLAVAAGRAAGNPGQVPEVDR